MALLGCLDLLRRPDGVELVVASIDHGLRPEAAAEVEAVRAVCRERDLPFHARTLSLATGNGLPARARAARHGALEEVASAAGVDAIALGHTATDQAETVLLNLARGAGLDGLSAMAAVDCGPPVARVRPLLGLERAEVRALCIALELRFFDDPTNADRTSARIVAREALLPRMEKLHAGATAAVVSAAVHAREANDALDVWAVRERAAHTSGPNLLRLDDAIRSLPPAVLRRVVRAVLLEAGLASDAVGHRLVADLCAAILKPGPDREFALQGGWLATVTRCALHVHHGAP